MSLNIAIVGAGIAGLVASIGLSRHGHNVHVYDYRQPNDYRDQSGAGIGLQPNAFRILKEWGLLTRLQKVAQDSEVTELRGLDGRLIANNDYRPRGPAYYVLRRVMKDLARQAALELGVKIHEGHRVTDVDPRAPALKLEDGSWISADLIVGADGSNSKVRSLLFPSFKAKVLNMGALQIGLPLDRAMRDPELQALVNGPHIVVTTSPSRSILISPVPHQNFLDIQLADHDFSSEQDPNPERPNEHINDLAWLRRRFSDHGPGIRKALGMVDSAFKWRFSEIVDGLPSWSSSTGKVVLLGDAAHAMQPWAGQGTAMGIEDAAVLAELLASTRPGQNLKPVLERYEQLRRPRCEKVRKYAKVIGAAWSEKDPERMKTRNLMWQKTINHPRYAIAKADGDAPYHSAEFQQWLDNYDALEEARKEAQKMRGPLSRI